MIYLPIVVDGGNNTVVGGADIITIISRCDGSVVFPLVDATARIPSDPTTVPIELMISLHVIEHIGRTTFDRGQTKERKDVLQEGKLYV